MSQAESMKEYYEAHGPLIDGLLANAQTVLEHAEPAMLVRQNNDSANEPIITVNGRPYEENVEVAIGSRDCDDRAANEISVMAGEARAELSAFTTRLHVLYNEIIKGHPEKVVGLSEEAVIGYLEAQYRRFKRDLGQAAVQQAFYETTDEIGADSLHGLGIAMATAKDWTGRGLLLAMREDELIHVLRLNDFSKPEDGELVRDVMHVVTPAADEDAQGIKEFFMARGHGRLYQIVRLTLISFAYAAGKPEERLQSLNENIAFVLSRYSSSDAKKLKKYINAEIHNVQDLNASDSLVNSNPDLLLPSSEQLMAYSALVQQLADNSSL